MFRFLVLPLFCLSMSGCSEISDVFMPAHAKVNKAFPPIAEVRVAEENLRAFIQQDKAARSSLDALYASRLELRALTCTQGLTIGRFASIATVKALPIGRDCLNAQDAQLLQYLGIRQVAVRFSQPPLRPLLPLGPATPVPATGGVDFFSGYAASGAGVAVMRGTRSEFISIELPSGKKISSFPISPETSSRVLLSPNGRVTAMNIGNSGVAFVDTETGAKLWDTRDFNQLYAWMPEVSAALASDSKNGALLVIDFQTGKIYPHSVSLRNQTWALPVSSTPSRVLVGAYKEFSLMEHVRDGDAVQGSIITGFRIKEAAGVSSSSPTLMLERKAIVFISGRDFMMFDLESGKETLWSTGEFLGNRYAKLSEETLLVDSYVPNTIGSKSWVFNIKEVTLSPVEMADSQQGIVSELVGRTGYMRRNHNQTWFGDVVPTGEATSLSAIMGAFNLERQIAQLEAATRAESAGAGSRSLHELSNQAPSHRYAPAPAPAAPPTDTPSLRSRGLRR